MSMDERFLDADIPDFGRVYRPLTQLRWLARRPSDYSPKLQQAWGPMYGGPIEWRDVPIVYEDAAGADGAREVQP